MPQFSPQIWSAYLEKSLERAQRLDIRRSLKQTSSHSAKPWVRRSRSGGKGILAIHSTEIGDTISVIPPLLCPKSPREKFRRNVSKTQARRKLGEIFRWFSALYFQVKLPQEISRKILDTFHKARNKVLSLRSSGSWGAQAPVLWGPKWWRIYLIIRECISHLRRTSVTQGFLTGIVVCNSDASIRHFLCERQVRTRIAWELQSAPWK